MSTVWEDTDGCAKQCRCALSVCLMTVLSFLNVIIMCCEINAPGYGNNFVDRLNSTYKLYLK